MIEFAAFLFIALVFLFFVGAFLQERERRQAHEEYWRARWQQIEDEKDEAQQLSARLRQTQSDWEAKSPEEKKEIQEMGEFVRMCRREAER